jgi:hypothetical protein
VTQAISGKLGMSSAMALSLNSSMSLPPKTSGVRTSAGRGKEVAK